MVQRQNRHVTQQVQKLSLAALKDHERVELVAPQLPDQRDAKPFDPPMAQVRQEERDARGPAASHAAKARAGRVPRLDDRVCVSSSCRLSLIAESGVSQAGVWTPDAQPGQHARANQTPKRSETPIRFLCNFYLRSIFFHFEEPSAISAGMFLLQIVLSTTRLTGAHGFCTVRKVKF
nr:hypothetical protein [Paracoccus jeotgali]